MIFVILPSVGVITRTGPAALQRVVHWREMVPNLTVLLPSLVFAMASSSRFGVLRRHVVMLAHRMHHQVAEESHEQ